MSKLIVPAIYRKRSGGLTIGFSPGPQPGTQTATYTEDTTTNMPNPERGFHKDVDFFSGNFAAVQTTHNMSIARSYIQLDAFRNSAISQAFLDSMQSRFAVIRSAGVKLVTRFSYSFTSTNDAPLNRVLEHLGQLAPILEDNQDVISVLQAGIIGRWGEWGASANNLNTPANKATITAALLDALPVSRMVQIRTPYHYVHANGLTYDIGSWSSGDAPSTVTTPFNAVQLAEADRFTGTDLSRLGHKNDSFFTNFTDAGTYAFPEFGFNNNTAHRTYLKNWLFDSSRWTVYGGEAADDVYQAWSDGNRYACADAAVEMPQVNVDYLNRDYGLTMINTWINNGCYDEFARKIGYRLFLESVTAPQTVQAGQPMTVELEISNSGFGKVYNPRPIDLVFVGEGGPHVARLTADARRDLPVGGETTTTQYTVNAPASLVLNQTYSLHLRLPDASSSIASDNRYAIRLANTGVWDASTGRNNLGLDVTAV